jgi:hypothetical protein
MESIRLRVADFPIQKEVGPESIRLWFLESIRLKFSRPKILKISEVLNLLILYSLF